MTTKKDPNVISFKKHKEEVDLILQRLGEKELHLEHRACTILELQKKELEYIKQYENLKAEFNGAKEYWETNTKTLHEELHRYSQIVEELRRITTDAQQLAKEYQKMYEQCKAKETIPKKKWYSGLFKNKN